MSGLADSGSSLSAVARTTMRAASTDSTMPSRRATRVTPESRATMPSMPVPISGERVRISGTAWRCMFEPISARLASSFSRNGISEAATETSWFGDTSIRVTSSGLAVTVVTVVAAEDVVLGELALLVDRRAGLGDVVPLLLQGGEELDLVVRPGPPTTLRYGVSMKPNSFTRA